MLSVKLSSQAKGVDQMLLAECFKDENCPNKDVLFCKGQTAPDKPDSRSKLTQATTAGQQGWKDKEHSERLRKALTAGSTYLTFPQQLTQVDGTVRTKEQFK